MIVIRLLVLFAALPLTAFAQMDTPLYVTTNPQAVDSGGMQALDDSGQGARTQQAISQIPAEKTSTELQAVQTRTFDVPYREIFRAVVSVLQDNKFKITFTDYNAGIIHAQGPTRQFSQQNGRNPDESLALARAAILEASRWRSARNRQTVVVAPGGQLYAYPVTYYKWYDYIPLIGSLVGGISDALSGERESLYLESRAISVSVDEQGKTGSRVRLAMTSELVAQDTGLINVDDLTDKPEIYQDMFSSIDKASFVISNTR